MELGLLAAIIQTLLTTALIAMAIAGVSRSAARRRHLATGTPARRILAYPRWVVGLGLGCAVMFSTFAWFAWHAPPSRGGAMVALVFIAFSLLGVVLVVSALADTFIVDEAGLERLRFGRPRRLAWGDLARVSAPWGGPGIRLETRDGKALEVAELVDGFGVLCDALLTRAPADLRVEAEAGACVLKGATLGPEPVQRSYARWFEAEEEAEPPPDLSPTDLAVAIGRAFAARLLWRHGSFVPFEARWTAAGAPHLTHGEPRGEDPGYAALRLEGREVVITTDAGTFRESLDG
ncbi:MAG: PH domain-containing protein [Synechococcus sp.]|nr:PH domain-containing protein [Synechococcus sp.]